MAEMNTFKAMVENKFNEVAALTEKKSGNKNPDYYKTLKEKKLWNIILELMTNGETDTVHALLNEIAQPAKAKTVIEIQEGDNFLELAKKYINKPGAAIIKAIEEQGFKLDGMTVVKA